MAVGAVPALAAANQGGASVAVSVNGLRNAKGVVQACMTAQPKAFPDCGKDPHAHKISVSAALAAKGLRFSSVQPGTYAIALLHDENANGKPDFALGMMPKEGFGFSRDAKVRMGPPAFTDAAVTIEDADRSLAIKMRYLF